MKSNKIGIHSRRSVSFLDSLFGIRKKSTLHREIILTETAYARSSTTRDVLLKAEESKTRAIDWIRKLQNR